MVKVLLGIIAGCLLALLVVMCANLGGDTSPEANAKSGAKLVKDRNTCYDAFTILPGSPSAVITHGLQGTPTSINVTFNSLSGYPLWDAYNVNEGETVINSGSTSESVLHGLTGTPTSVVVTMTSNTAGYQLWDGYNINEGSFTLNAGSTSYTVSHGLAGTPTIALAQPNGGTIMLRTGTKTSTTFMVTRTGTDTADRTVDWIAYSDDSPSVPVSSVGTETFTINRPASTSGTLSGYYRAGS